MPAQPRLRVAVDVRCLETADIRGFARYTLELLDALAGRPDLDLVAWTDRSLAFDLPVPVERVMGRSELIREQLALPRALRRLGVHTLLCPANRGLPATPVVPSVLTLHDAVEWDRSLVPRARGRGGVRFGYASVASLAAATLVLTVSEASARAIAERLGVARSRLRVVHEAADERFFADPPSAQLERVRARYGVGERAILYLGGFDAKKDVPTLVRAFARLDRELAPQLLLAGGLDPGAEGVRALASDLEVAESVSFCGFVEDADLPALYRTAAVFVFPGLAEGFGLPVVEALASGTATVVADAASLPEVAGDGALRFPPRDDAAAAAQLAELLRDDALRESVRKQGLSRARELTWTETARRTEDVLREAATVPLRRRLVREATALRALPRWLR